VTVAEQLPGPETAAAPADQLPALLESLLFVSPSPARVSRLAQAAGVTVADVEAALQELAAGLGAGARGLRLQRKDDRVSLTTAPEHAPFIEKYLGLDPSARLSTAAMETLAVIAYRQPLTRPQIEAIRGVNCDGVLKTLLSRELIEAVGRLEQPGRPFLYGTTFQFLQYFGLSDLSDLPTLPEPSSSAEKGT
jgi:segregation and condensation protein B